MKENILNRIDAVTKISDIRIKMNGIQPPPKSVKIELTGRCNHRCKFCAVRTRKEQPKKDMDYYLFQRITEDMRYSGVEEIGVFYLGESFMNPRLLIQAVRWLKEELKFPYVFLTSNASVSNIDDVEEVMKAGLDSLKWSVNCATPEQFKEITGSPEKMFYEMLKVIKETYLVRNLSDCKTMLSASSILYEGKQKEKMDEMLKVDVIPFVDKHYWLPLYQMSMYADKIKTEMGYVPTAGNMGRLDDNTLQPLRKPIPCWSVFTEGHVRVNGELSACCFGADDRFDMGILDGTNFMRQWNSKKFKNLREAHIKTITEGQSALKGTICEVCVAHDYSK